jgi:hypothetical protein
MGKPSATHSLAPEFAMRKLAHVGFAVLIGVAVGWLVRSPSRPPAAPSVGVQYIGIYPPGSPEEPTGGEQLFRVVRVRDGSCLERSPQCWLVVVTGECEHVRYHVVPAGTAPAEP